MEHETVKVRLNPELKNLSSWRQRGLTLTHDVKELTPAQASWVLGLVWQGEPLAIKVEDKPKTSKATSGDEADGDGQVEG